MGGKPMLPVRILNADVTWCPSANSSRRERHLCSPAISTFLVGRTSTTGHPLPTKNGFRLSIATCGSWAKIST
eukprot:7435395-Pyramimonas_sp.AAC.1